MLISNFLTRIDNEAPERRKYKNRVDKRIGGIYRNPETKQPFLDKLTRIGNNQKIRAAKKKELELTNKKPLPKLGGDQEVVELPPKSLDIKPNPDVNSKVKEDMDWIDNLNKKRSRNNKIAKNLLRYGAGAALGAGALYGVNKLRSRKSRSDKGKRRGRYYG